MLLWKWKRRVRIVPQEASITKFQVGFLNQNLHPQSHLNLRCHTLPKTSPWQIVVELMWTELFRNSYFAIFCRATNRQQNMNLQFAENFPFLAQIGDFARLQLISNRWQATSLSASLLMQEEKYKKQRKIHQMQNLLRFNIQAFAILFWKQLLNRN